MKKIIAIALLLFSVNSFAQRPNTNAAPFNQYPTRAIFQTKEFDKIDWECLVVCKSAAGAFQFFYLKEKNPTVAAPLTIISQSVDGNQAYFFVRFFDKGDTFRIHLDAVGDKINLQKTAGNLSQPYNKDYLPERNFSH